MPTFINISQAKSSLSRLVAKLEQGKEREIVITRSGRPAARLLPLEKQRIGIAKGKFAMPESIDSHNAELEKLFTSQSD